MSLTRHGPPYMVGSISIYGGLNRAAIMVHNASSQQVLPPLFSSRLRLGLISLHCGENCGLYRGHECVLADKKFHKLKNDDDFAPVSVVAIWAVFKRKRESQLLQGAFDPRLVFFIIDSFIFEFGLAHSHACVSLLFWAVQAHWCLQTEF